MIEDPDCLTGPTMLFGRWIGRSCVCLGRKAQWCQTDQSSQNKSLPGVPLGRCGVGRGREADEKPSPESVVIDDYHSSIKPLCGEGWKEPNLGLTAKTYLEVSLI